MTTETMTIHDGKGIEPVIRYTLPTSYRSDVRAVRWEYRRLRKAGLSALTARHTVIRFAIAFGPLGGLTEQRIK